MWNKTPEYIFSDYTRPVRYSIHIVIGVWSDNFIAVLFVSFIVTVSVPDIEGIQNKVNMFM